MKLVKLGLLITVLALGLAACNRSGQQPSGAADQQNATQQPAQDQMGGDQQNN